MLKSIYDLAKEELNENGSIGYTFPDGKYHLFVFVDDNLGDDEDDKWYIVEPNKVVDGAHEPIAPMNGSAPYNDFETLLLACLWAIEFCESYDVED